MLRASGHVYNLHTNYINCLMFLSTIIIGASRTTADTEKFIHPWIVKLSKGKTAKVKEPPKASKGSCQVSSRTGTENFELPRLSIKKEENNNPIQRERKGRAYDNPNFQ